MEEFLRAGGEEAAARPAAVAPVAAPARAIVADPAALRQAASIASALGGAGNIASVEACAATRVRVEVVNPAIVNDASLRQSGITSLMRLDGNVLHLIVGSRCEAIAAALTSDFRNRRG